MTLGLNIVQVDETREGNHFGRLWRNSEVNVKIGTKWKVKHGGEGYCGPLPTSVG